MVDVRRRKWDPAELLLSGADAAAETEFQLREQNGVNAFYWVDDGLAYAIAANAGRDRLLKLAEIVCR